LEVAYGLSIGTDPVASLAKHAAAALWIDDSSNDSADRIRKFER